MVITERKKKNLLDLGGSKWFASFPLYQISSDLLFVLSCLLPAMYTLYDEKTGSELSVSFIVTAYISHCTVRAILALGI